MTSRSVERRVDVRVESGRTLAFIKMGKRSRGEVLAAISRNLSKFLA